MLFKYLCTPYQFPVCLRNFLFHFLDWLWCPDSCHNILTLGIGEVFTEQNLFTRAWIPCECNTSCRIWSHITKNHHYNAHSSTQIFRYVVQLSIYLCPFIVPGFKNGPYGKFQLLIWILREILTIILYYFFEYVYQFLQCFSIKVNIIFRSIFFLQFIHGFFKIFSRYI